MIFEKLRAELIHLDHFPFSEGTLRCQLDNLWLLERKMNHTAAVTKDTICIEKLYSVTNDSFIQTMRYKNVSFLFDNDIRISEIFIHIDTNNWELKVLGPY